MRLEGDKDGVTSKRLREGARERESFEASKITCICIYGMAIFCVNEWSILVPDTAVLRYTRKVTFESEFIIV